MSGETWLVIEWRRLLVPSIDLYSAVVTLGWALVFALQPHVFTDGPSFAAMRALAPASTWSTLLLLSALLQLGGVVVRKPPLRFVSLTVGAGWWMFCCVMFGLAGLGVRTGTVAYGSLSLLLLARTLRPERQ